MGVTQIKHIRLKRRKCAILQFDWIVVAEQLNQGTNWGMLRECLKQLQMYMSAGMPE